MSVPMSQYEALLEEVRCLRRKAQHVQQLAAPLISSSSNASSVEQQIRYTLQDVNQAHSSADYDMESLGLDVNHQTTAKTTNGDYEHRLGVHSNTGGPTDVDTNCSEDEYGRVVSSSTATHMSVSSEPISQKTRGMANLYHGTWPVERTTMWNSEPTNLGPVSTGLSSRIDHTSVMSFASSSGGAPLDRVLSSPDHSRRSSQQLEAKMDMVYSLLAMLGGQEHADMGETLLALSTSPESCLAMRQSGCIPLLVQLVQSDKDGDTRKKASQALHNLVYAQPEEKLKKRETRVLKLLEQARLYTEALKNNTEYVPEAGTTSEEGDKHPTLTIAHLMKLSFDEGHRQAICQLGGIHVIANLLETEHSLHSNITEDTQCILMRRYACMALTNLTFGDSGNKALLCSFKDFMRALVVHLQSPSDELRQVTASVLRNLSWRADPVSKEILREVGTVTGLMKAAMMDSKENTLKSILSALWNLSAHCTENKAEICAIDGALGFLVDMLSYKTPSKSLAVIENSGGILRNISSQVAVREDYRHVLREHNCLQVLLEQLKSPSLTIVSNACGTLWNLSAKNAQDQETLWQMGAPSMLRSLNHSKHKMIAMGSSAALKNLLSSRPSHAVLPQMDATAKAMDLPVLPTLGARKQKALLQDLDQNLHETFDNIESPTKTAGEEKFEKYLPTQEFLQKTRKKHVFRSESEECVSHSELVYESRTSRSDTSARNDVTRTEERLSRREEHSIRKEELKIDAGKTRRSLRDDYVDRSNKDVNQLCQPFASLNINEPSTSATYQKDYANKSSRTIQNFGSSSLPYAKRPGAYITVRNNYSDCGFEDEIDSGDQPIDFSRKYDEMKSEKNDEKTYNASKMQNRDEDDTYGIYAETDLDQPTDYSLRYAEDDSDSDICDKKNEFIQDTVKTYYTEGTPYETPFNFSTATSMSDLRIETNDKVIDNDTTRTTEKTKMAEKNPPSDLDEKDHCSVEDISENESRQKNNDKVLKSQFSSGLMSPEKPINYCDEGTPGYFSRVSSFGSLNSIPANESLMKCRKEAEAKANENEPIAPEQVVGIKSDASPHEGAKAVKFEQTVNYAEETPLMFSRSSSLASLDSVEQHSIHDDRSSVVSDFSRLTSGLVSPSELPDSPSQTVPPSPKPRKGPLEYPGAASRASVGGGIVVVGGGGGVLPLFQRTAADGRPQPAPRSIQKPSVFEDNVTKFKEESTPVQFSTATSLSSLTIDDHDESQSTCERIKASPATSENTESTGPIPATSGVEISEKPEEEEEGEEEDAEKSDVEQKKEDSNNTSSELNDDFVHISDNEGDDDILADCINIGMQNNRHRQNKEIVVGTGKIPTPSSFKYTPKLRPQSSGIPLPRSGIPTPRSSSTKIAPTKSEILNTSDTICTYYTEDTPAVLSHAGSNSDLSAISIPNDKPAKPAKKDYLSDDSSSNLSGDNGDNILAECIQSAMPKPKKIAQKPLVLRQIPTLAKNVTTSTPIKSFGKDTGTGRNDIKSKLSKDENRRSKMPVYAATKDETEKFAIENSPCQFSLRSSLSDLTVDGSVTDLKRSNLVNRNEASGPSCVQHNETDPPIEKREASNLSRQGSLSSLSVESVGSLEAEQALLEQCISSGMPKSRLEANAFEKPVGVATKQYNLSKIKYQKTAEQRLSSVEIKSSKIAGYEKRKNPSADSKNVFVTSVVENTRPIRAPEEMEREQQRPTATATIADVRERNGSDHRGNDPNRSRSPNAVTCGTRTAAAKTGTLPDRSSPIIGISSIDPRNNGYDSGKSETIENNTSPIEEFETVIAPSDDCKESNGLALRNSDLMLHNSDSALRNSDSDLLLHVSDDATKNTISNRMLDPDAMIESLDRFTAELVSQAASHMQQQKEESKFQASVTEGDTWNEDVSPNDVTFPSISGSTPNVITFSDEINQKEIDDGVDVDVVDGIVETEQKSNDFSSLNTLSTLTESTLIAMEATKMATTFRNEANMSMSAASIELDSIQPPSQLNSLTNSANELEIRAKRSPKMIARKKSLPQGLMVRRALSNSLNQASSIESLSNLDNINAPSALSDIDFLDLESSMTSVASLQSEVADPKADFIVNGVVGSKDQSQANVYPIFDVKQPANMLHLIANHSNCSELENVNPPSVFNEITDLCNSLDAFEDGDSTANIDVTLIQTESDDVTTHFSDGTSLTPIHTDDVSSNESTPRKSRRALTAKQKRNLAKDRYKTYTVDADLAMKDDDNSTDDVFLLQRINSDDSGEYKTLAATTTTTTGSEVIVTKLTPKERRLSNRSRFETQVLEPHPSRMLENEIPPSPPNTSSTNNSNSSPLSDNSDNSPLNSPTFSPAKSKLSIRRNFLQKRLENRDRFKTKTLSESSLSPEILSSSPTPNVNNTTDLHLLLQKETNAILKTLSETKAKVTTDELLDCETLSLVSNEDDSEYNSGCSINYRTYHKSWGFAENGCHLPVVTAKPSSEHNGLENYDERNSDNDCYAKTDNSEDVCSERNFSDEENEAKLTVGKPKIVKPDAKIGKETNVEVAEEQTKGIRGRRRALYSKTGVTKTVLKSPTPVAVTNSHNIKSTPSKLSTPSTNRSVSTNKPPLPKAQKPPPPPVTTGKTKSLNPPKQISPARSQIKSPNYKSKPEVKLEKEKNECVKPPAKPALERQGTFTKEDGQSSKSKIPTTVSSIPKATRIARAVVQPPLSVRNKYVPPKAVNGTRSGLVKSASTDRANKTASSTSNRIVNRSPSVDARDVVKRSSLQYSSSNSNLKNGAGTVKRASAPEATTQRSNSNSSLTSNSSGSKQVTSKIAALWKKSGKGEKKSTVTNPNANVNGAGDENPTRLIRSNTFENKDSLILQNVEAIKRVSRLGSVVVVNETETRIEYECRNVANKPSQLTY